MDLPSVLGGAVQGFKDFGTGVVDLFGTGGASVLDLIATLQNGQATTQRQDDFRKWLYNTDDNKDADAKGLGTILNGVQTISDYIPGVSAVTRNPLFNAGQGAIGGIADEFKQYGKDYDLGRAGQRALVSGGAALASGALGDALNSSSTPILRSNTIKGTAKGALGGAINQGGYTAIEGGNLSDILSSAGQGATMGGVIGGATGMMQDFKPAKTYATGLTEDEKAARMANAKNMLANEQNPERIAELNAQIKKLGGNDPEVLAAIDAVVAPEKQEMVTLYRGMSAPDAPTLKKYLDDMRNPDIEPRQYAGASLFGRGYNATESLKEATGYAKSSDNGPAMGVFSIKLPKDSFVQMTEDAGNRERDFIIRAHDKYGGYHPEIDPKFNPEAMAQGKKDFMDYLIKNNIAGSVSDGGTYTIMNPQMTSGFEVKKLLPEAENYLKQNGYKSLEDIKNDPQVMQAVDAILTPEQKKSFVVDENGNPRTFYHGSPNANITEFDINQAGKNTSSGERALYFTDSPEVADDFSYARLPSDSMFIDNRGAKGRVYPVNLEMNNPLDLDNLTDAQIRELWQYASPLGQLDGQEKFIKNLTEFRDAAHNGQLTKTLLDLDKLANSPYDGFTARMYPNQANQAREYAVFDNSKVKMLDDVLASGDRAINDAPTPLAGSGVTIAGKDRSWDELYDMLSNDAGTFENENRTPITVSPSQLRSEIQAIDAKYPDDLPDDVWDRRYDLNQQLKAAENGYNSPYDYYVGESKKNFRQDFESRPDKYKAKIADIESRIQRQAALDRDIANASPRKLAQFNLIQQKNPAPNETLTWIRSPKDILTWDEAIAGAEGDNAFTWPDYTLEDALRDQKKHSMTVYSSYPIKGGTFVTPSFQQASDYAGGGRVYSKVIRPDDVAWINGDEGQYAYTRKK